MNLPAGLNRSTFVVGGTLALVLGLFLFGVLYFWSLRHGYAQEIDNIRPRTARLLGILESQEALAHAGEEARDILAGVAYSPDRDAASSAASMQQDVRELLTSAGLFVSSSQILPRREGEGFELLRLNVSVEGNIDGFDAALSELELARPLVLVESIRVKSGGRRAFSRSRAPASEVEGDPRLLTSTLELISLRLTD